MSKSEAVLPTGLILKAISWSILRKTVYESLKFNIYKQLELLFTRLARCQNDSHTCGYDM